MIDFIIQDITGYLTKYIESAVIVATVFALGRFVAALFLMLGSKGHMYWKKWLKILLSLPVDFVASFYVFMVVVITFFSRMEGSTDVVNTQLFSTFRSDLASRIYIIENIVMFIPLGVFLRWYGLKHFRMGIPLIIGFSTLIEMMQYLTGRGRMEVDDIMTNTIGGFMGFILMKLVFGIKYLVQKRSLK